MRWLRKWRLRLLSLVARTHVERDLHDELCDYLDRETSREIATGNSPEEARGRALAALQGVERLKEECRDARHVRWLEDSLADLRFAVRASRRAPAFTITVIAALACCIGLNAAIFSVVDTVLFRPLPFPKQDRLVSVSEGVPSLSYPVLPFACSDYLFVARNNRSFASVGAYQTDEYEVSGAGFPSRVPGARFSASVFRVLQVSAATGRVFTPTEDDGSARVVTLTDGFARRLFGTPIASLGRTILLNRVRYQVIGTMPSSFSFPIRGARFNDRPASFFIPVSWTSEDRTQTVSNFDWSVIARLRPGVSMQTANVEVQSLLDRLVDDYPAAMKRLVQHLPNFALHAQVLPFREEFTGNVQQPLLVLLAAVAVVLLIGCADVANLMFSRMAGRQPEFALRAALGAGRGRLLRQTLAEGLLLSMAGGACGLLLANGLLPLLLHLAPDSLPRLNEVGLNWRMTIFVLALTLLTPLLFCLAPFASSAGVGLGTPLRGEGRTSSAGKRQLRLMSVSVVGQLSLAFVLLTVAGLLGRSLIRASGTNPGFEVTHLISMRVVLPDATYTTRSLVKGVFNRLLEKLSTVPNVERVGAISDLPTGSTSNVLLSAQGVRGTVRADTLFCLGDALGSLRVKLLRGRVFEPRDYTDAAPGAVISEGLARKIWPGKNPLGEHIKFGVDDGVNQKPWMTVVGVASDVRTKLTSDAPRLALFMPLPDWPKAMNVLVRTSSNPRSLAGTMRNALHEIDPQLPAGTIESVDQMLGDSLAPERFRTWLLLSFAGAATLLAALGISGLLAYNTAQRKQEFGIRIALGATGGDLLGLILRHYLGLATMGILIGLAASLIASRTVAALLYGTSPDDPMTLVAVSLMLIFIAIAASLIPAWHVTRLNAARSLGAN